MTTSPLHDAIIQADLSKVESLIAHPDTDPNKQNAIGDAALHLAIANTALANKNSECYLKIVHHILSDPRTNLDLTNNISETPFDVAICCYCFDHYISGDDTSSSSYKVTANAISNVIRALIRAKAAKEGSDSNAINLSEKYYSASPEKQIACMKVLCETLLVHPNFQEYFSFDVPEPFSFNFQEYFMKCTTDDAYPTIGITVSKAIEEIQYYAKIARRYQFFKNNHTNIDYALAETFTRLSFDEKQAIIMLGYREFYQSSTLEKLPQEILDSIRLFCFGTSAPSHHAFKTLGFHHKPVKATDTDAYPVSIVVEKALNSIRIKN